LWPGAGGEYNPAAMEMVQARTLPARRVLLRVPLVPAAAAMMAGIVAGRHGPLGDGAWAAWAAAALAAALASLLLKRHVAAGVAVAGAIVALAAVHARLAFFRLADDDIATYAAGKPAPAALRGRIAQMPSIEQYDSAMEWPREPRTTFELEAQEIRTSAGWRGAGGRVGVSIAEGDTRLRRGMRVELLGRLRRIAPPRNSGQHDRAAAGRLTGKLVELAVPGVDGVTVLGAGGGGWLRRLRDAAGTWAGRHLRRFAPGRSGMLVEALIVGRRDPALRDANLAMKRSGIAHLMSISGLHLGIFLGFVYLLCRLVLLGPRQAAAAALLCLLGYLLVAETRSPLLRSAVMAALLCAGMLVHRPGAALNALALAAIVLLAAEPMELFSPAFQLSFAAVAGLLLLTRPLKELLFGRWIRRRGLMVFRDRSRAARWLHFAAADWAMNGAAVALVASAVSAPLIAYHFRIFSPWGPLATVPATALTILVVVPGYLSLATAWAPDLSGVLAVAAGHAGGWFLQLNALSRHLPLLFYELRPVGVWWVLACYAAIAAIVFCRRVPRGRPVAAAAVAVLVAATAWTQRAAPPPSVAELDLLDVGAGQCALLRAPSGTTWLLDAGSLGNASAGDDVCVPFVLTRRLPRPRAAFVSHANTDHYNALPALLDRGWVRTVYLNGYFGHGEPEVSAAGAARFLDVCRRRDAQVRRLAAPAKLALDERTTVEVLWPPPGRQGLSVNDTSLVLRVVCDGRSVLLCGDIEQAAQAALLAERPGDLRADVLVLPHHGAWAPALPEFLAAVAPRHVLASTPRRLREELGNMLAGRLCTTAQCGWVHVRFGRGELTIRTMRQGEPEEDE